MRRFLDPRVLTFVGGAIMLAQPALAQCPPSFYPPSAPPAPSAPSSPAPSAPSAPAPSTPSTPGPSTPGPSGPSSPGGSGPSTPAPPPPTAPGGAGPSTGSPAAPTAPGGGGPARRPAPTPDGPVTPKVADSSTQTGVIDTSTWQYWWDNNKDQYLNLRRRVRTGGPSTPVGDGMVFGGNEPILSLMPSTLQIQRTIVPALFDVIDKEDSTEIVRSTLLALAKIGVDPAGPDAQQVRDLLEEHLADKNWRIAEAAVVGLGLLGDWNSTQTLVGILADANDGRRLLGENSVPMRMRSQAAFALGLLAQRTDNEDVRRYVVQNLTQEFPGDRNSFRELRAACTTAVGLVPLEATGISPKEAEGLVPSTNLETQIAWLLERFEDKQTHETELAHLPTALARLTQKAGPEWRTTVAKAILEPIDRGARAKNSVRQSCVLAIGQLGDADGDKIDRDIRVALERLVGDVNQETRNFALIALAQVGGRAGTGAGDSYQGTKDVRKELLNTLARGKSRQKPWAGLALGILGHSLNETGGPISKDASRALEQMLAGCKSPADVGAYAIALGLRQDSDFGEALRESLEEASADNARSDIAIACGLLGDEAAIEGLQELVKDSENSPAALAQSSIALALLGQKSAARNLSDKLGDAKGLAKQASISTALGFIGDRNCVDSLVASLQDDGRTSQSRAFAAMALGMVADKDDEPWQACLTQGFNYHAGTQSMVTGDGSGLLELP